jgi:hypothetical protein
LKENHENQIAVCAVAVSDRRGGVWRAHGSTGFSNVFIEAGGDIASEHAAYDAAQSHQARRWIDN